MSTLQLFKSSAVRLYVFANKLVISSENAPLDQEVVYGGVPPVMERSITPVLFPKQSTSVFDTVVIIALAGSEILVLKFVTQLLKSVKIKS